MRHSATTTHRINDSNICCGYQGPKRKELLTRIKTKKKKEIHLILSRREFLSSLVWNLIEISLGMLPSINAITVSIRFWSSALFATLEPGRQSLICFKLLILIKERPRNNKHATLNERDPSWTIRIRVLSYTEYQNWSKW